MRLALEVLLVIFLAGGVGAFFWLVLWGAVEDGRDERRRDKHLHHR